MFTVVIEQLSELDDGALDARIRELELEQRRNAAEQAAAIADAESRRLHTVDGYRSMKGYLRATCNWSSAEATQGRRRARLVDTICSTSSGATAVRATTAGRADTQPSSCTNRQPR